MEPLMGVADLPATTLAFEGRGRHSALTQAGRTHSGLAQETYASFLLLAIAVFTLAGYLGLALFFVGAVR